MTDLHLAEAMPLLGAMLAAYLVGSTPTAVVLAKHVAGIDIREHGSGNPGASNVFRTLGWRWAAATFGIDVMKGYVPVWFVARFAENLVHPVFAQSPVAVMGWIGFGAFAGHCYSPFLRFGGGKGAATGLGAMYALAPQAMTLTVLIYAGALFTTKTFSMATLIASLFFPLMLYLREGSLQIETLAWGALVPTLLLFTHRSNIKRLLCGSEHGLRKENGLDEDETESN